MRCFIASFPSAASAQRLARLVPEALTGRRGTRAVPVANYHVTLKFLGSRSDAEVHRLLTLIDDLPRAGIDARTSHYLCLPSRRRARVIAVGIDSGGALEELGAAVAARLHWLQDLDDRPFVPHLTLIRARRPVKVGPLPSSAPVDVAFDPPALYRSETRPEGAVYRKVLA